MNELCEGCATKKYLENMFKDFNTLPPCRYTGDENICPCINCLVKVVCLNKPVCDIFIKGIKNA